MSEYDDVCDDVAASFEGEIERLQGENSHLIKVNGSLEVEVDQLEKEVESMRKDLDSANECNIVLYSEVERLNQEIVDLKNDKIEGY